MRKVLILSPHFPPSTLAGVHRARHLAKHLPTHGWRPIVIRADERYYAETGEPELAALVPKTVEQFRTKALPAKLTRLAGVGDIGLRAFPYFAKAIRQAAREKHPELVLITGSPFYPMLLSGRIASRLGLPVILDFQDPWVSAEGATRPHLSKGRMAHHLACLLEPRALRHASFITSVSDIQNAQMAERYPWVDATRTAAIPIGGDPEDFDAVRARPPANPTVRLDPGRINLSYVGTFLPRAGALVRQVFKAVALFREREPQIAARLRLNFVGTSNQPNHHDAYRVMPIAVEEGIGDLVSETPQRVAFLEALHILANSNGLLLIGSDEPHYTASKIYPALMSGRPYLSLFHASSSAHEILSAAGGGRAFAFSTMADLATLPSELAVGLQDLAARPETLGSTDPNAYERFTACSVAGQFAKVFERAMT